MAGSRSKYMVLGGIGVAAAAAVVYFSLFWPPASQKQVQGAIGKRDVYREAQLSDKDVGVAGKGSVTVDDLKKLVQSQEFRQLAGNAAFQNLVANAQLAVVLKVQNQQAALCGLQSFMSNASFTAALQNQQFQQLLVSNQFQSLLQQGGLGQNNAQVQALLNQAGLAGNQNVVLVVANAQFQGVLNQLAGSANYALFVNLIGNQNMQAMLKNASFQQLLQMPGITALLNNAQVQSLASQAQLQNLAGNASLQNAIYQMQGSGH